MADFVWREAIGKIPVHAAFRNFPFRISTFSLETASQTLGYAQSVSGLGTEDWRRLCKEQGSWQGMVDVGILMTVSACVALGGSFT